MKFFALLAVALAKEVKLLFPESDNPDSPGRGMYTFEGPKPVTDNFCGIGNIPGQGLITFFFDETSTTKIRALMGTITKSPLQRKMTMM